MVTGCVSEDLLLASETCLSAPLTAQAVTCFLCFALVGINSKLAAVQEQLFQNFIPTSEPGSLPELRFPWMLKAWDHSHPAHVRKFPPAIRH